MATATNVRACFASAWPPNSVAPTVCNTLYGDDETYCGQDSNTIAWDVDDLLLSSWDDRATATTPTPPWAAKEPDMAVSQVPSTPVSDVATDSETMTYFDEIVASLDRAVTPPRPPMPAPVSTTASAAPSLNLLGLACQLLIWRNQVYWSNTAWTPIDIAAWAVETISSSLDLSDAEGTYVATEADARLMDLVFSLIVQGDVLSHSRFEMQHELAAWHTQTRERLDLLMRFDTAPLSAKMTGNGDDMDGDECGVGDHKAILRAWISRNIDVPYPTPTEKEMLMRRTGLNITQLNDWFINARRRILPKLINTHIKGSVRA